MLVVSLCTNKSNNSSDVTFYRVLREKSIRKQYHRLLCKDSFSQNARVCYEHFENGVKLNRNHLPSIFPWRKKKCEGIKNTGISLIDITNIDSKTRKVVSNTETKNVEENDPNEYTWTIVSKICYIRLRIISKELVVSVQTEMNGEKLESLQAK